VTNFDPVATGLVDSLANPGGNLTGLTRFTRELSGKRLELFKEVDRNYREPGLFLRTPEPLKHMRLLLAV
jgi:ABC-type uncharacterized transport system substrate-binding protein